MLSGGANEVVANISLAHTTDMVLLSPLSLLIVTIVLVSRLEAGFHSAAQAILGYYYIAQAALSLSIHLPVCRDYRYTPSYLAGFVFSSFISFLEKRLAYTHGIMVYCL